MINEKQLADSFKTIIEAIGEDTSREGLIKTPQRVASMYSELFSGMHTNPDQVLTTDFAENQCRKSIVPSSLLGTIDL